jgi:hypothetical protein
MKLVSALLAVAASATAAYALAPEQSPPALRLAPEGTTAIAIFAPRASYTTSGTMQVCLYPQARPRELPVIRMACRGGGDRCAAFVAVPNEEADIIMSTYDFDEPPTVPVNGVCEASRLPALGNMADRPN